MVALAKLLQQHAVAGFEAERVEEIAQIGEWLGETLCTRCVSALLVARVQQARMLRQRRGKSSKLLLDRLALRIEPRFFERLVSGQGAHSETTGERCGSPCNETSAARELRLALPVRQKIEAAGRRRERTRGAKPPQVMRDMQLRRCVQTPGIEKSRAHSSTPRNANPNATAAAGSCSSGSLT